MPVTRSELRKEYEQNHVNVTNGMVLNMFNSICDEVTSYNNCGMTECCIVFRDPKYWSQQPLIDRVMKMLKAHYTDSHIYTHDKTITIVWTYADNFANSFELRSSDKGCFPPAAKQELATVKSVDDLRSSMDLVGSSVDNALRALSKDEPPNTPDRTNIVADSSTNVVMDELLAVHP